MYICVSVSTELHEVVAYVSGHVFSTVPKFSLAQLLN